MVGDRQRKARLRRAIRRDAAVLAEKEISPPTFFERVASWWATIRSLILNIVGALLFLGMIFVLAKAIAHPKIVISPISVPKELADRGYTPEEVALELKGALAKLIKTAHSNKRTADFDVGPSEPDIVVPTTGLPLETIASVIREFIASFKIWRTTNDTANGLRMAGDVVSKDNIYLLQLVVRGRRYEVDEIVTAESKRLPEAIALVSEKLLEIVDPYILAASLKYSDPERAITIANSIVSDRPDDDSTVAWAHTLIGRIKLEAHKLEEATNEARKAIAIDPRIATSHIVMGLALDEADKTEEAIKQYKEAINLDPKDAAAHNDLGLVLDESGNTEEAIAQYKEAIRLDPKDAVPHNNIGLIRQKQSRAGEAIEEYKKASSLDPSYALPHFNLAMTLYEEGKPDDAISEYKVAIILDPKDAVPHNNIGGILFDLKKYDDALAEDRKAIEIDRNYAAPHIGAGNVLATEGKIDEAIVEYRAAIAIDPKNSMVHNNLGQALQSVSWQSKAKQEAIAEFRIAIRLDPKNPKAHHNLGNSLLSDSKILPAIVEYRAASELEGCSASLQHGSSASRIRSLR